MKNLKQFAIMAPVFILLVSSVFNVLPSLAYLPPPLPKTIKRSPPMTANLSLEGITSLGEEGELFFIVTSQVWLPKTEIKVLLPKGISKVRGNLFWTGDISAGQTVKIQARVRAEKEGEWVIEGNAKSRLDANVVGKSDFLYVLTSQSVVKLSKTNPKASNEMDTKLLERKAQFSQSNVAPQSPGTVTVYGYWYFHEEDGTTQRAARRARVELWDSDLGGLLNWWLATTYTDDNGYYEFPPVDNNDGWLEDGLDVFVKIFTDNSVVWVSSTGGSVYWGQTSVDSNVPDGMHNMGSWIITGDNRGAAGIFDTIIIGYDYAHSLGYDHAEVQAKWRSGGTYTELDGLTMDFIAGDEWDEDVILHEYGHSVQHSIYGEWIPNTGGPHTWNQHTNSNMAFSEGWPTFWGVAANFEMGYGDTLYPQDTWYRDHVDQIINHDLETDPHAPGDDVEGAIACLLWDIYDFHSDGRDSLGATMIPIWDVFRNYLTGGHHVYDIHEFWDGWLARGWDFAQLIWGIYLDHGIQKDFTPPSNPTGWSGSHSVSVWSNDNTIYIYWWGASDDISGVHGYSFVWDTSSTTLPDTTMDTISISTISPPLADGNSWYFHIRTVDYADNWNLGALHVGPFYIDTAPPSNPTGWSSSHTVGGTSSDNTIDMSWWGASDSLSGVYGYSYAWTTSSSTIPDTTVDTTGTSTTSPPLSNGGWYFHIRTRDNAGNWNPNALHIGPFYISTGGDGGGCPYVSTWDGDKYVLDNNLLATFESLGGADVTDYYLLQQMLAQREDGSYSLLLSEFENEHDFFDHVQLIAVDHVSDVNVAVSPCGEILTYTNPSPTVSAIDDNHRNVKRLLSSIDGNYYEGYNGSYIDLNFGDLDVSQGAKLVMRADLPPEAEKWSIHIQVQDSQSSWNTVATVIPRVYWSTEIINMTKHLPDAKGNLKVRLYFTANYKIDFVGLDTSPQATILVQEGEFVSAIHSVGGDVTTKLLYSDEIYAGLVPGENIQLAFELPEQTMEARTYIITVEGHYYTITA